MSRITIKSIYALPILLFLYTGLTSLHVLSTGYPFSYRAPFYAANFDTGLTHRLMPYTGYPISNKLLQTLGIGNSYYRDPSAVLPFSYRSPGLDINLGKDTGLRYYHSTMTAVPLSYRSPGLATDLGTGTGLSYYPSKMAGVPLPYRSPRLATDLGTGVNPPPFFPPENHFYSKRSVNNYAIPGHLDAHHLPSSFFRGFNPPPFFPPENPFYSKRFGKYYEIPDYLNIHHLPFSLLKGHSYEALSGGDKSNVQSSSAMIEKEEHPGQYTLAAKLENEFSTYMNTGHTSPRTEIKSILPEAGAVGVANTTAGAVVVSGC